MKKLLALSAIGLCLLISGCSGELSVPTVNPAVDCRADAEYDGAGYDLRITYVNDQTAAVTFLAPESLEGIKVARSNGQYSLSLGTLLCRSQQGLSGESALPRRILTLLDAVKNTSLTPTENNEQGCTFSGSADGQDFTLVTDRSGKPVSLKSGLLTVQFSK